MEVTLGLRTTQTVAVCFEKAQNPVVRQMLPQKARTLEEALADYEKTLQPDAFSFGRTILADGQYMGDVWCCCIDLAEEPNAMLSYCLFDEQRWKQGVATKAVSLFLKEAAQRFGLKSMGAFTCRVNAASIHVLEKNGFVLMESFEEDGKSSCDYQRSWPD